VRLVAANEGRTEIDNGLNVFVVQFDCFGEVAEERSDELTVPVADCTASSRMR